MPASLSVAEFEPFSPLSQPLNNTNSAAAVLCEFRALEPARYLNRKTVMLVKSASESS